MASVASVWHCAVLRMPVTPVKQLMACNVTSKAGTLRAPKSALSEHPGVTWTARSPTPVTLPGCIPGPERMHAHARKPKRRTAASRTPCGRLRGPRRGGAARRPAAAHAWTLLHGTHSGGCRNGRWTTPGRRERQCGRCLCPQRSHKPGPAPTGIPSVRMVGASSFDHLGTVRQSTTRNTP